MSETGNGAAAKRPRGVPGDAPESAPWRGRPRVAEPRSAWLTVRCTASARAAVTAAAERAGLTDSAYALSVLLNEPPPRSARRPQVDRAELGRALGLIGLYGSNVNQLARAANMHGDQLTAAQLDEMLREVRDMRGALRRALGYGD